jgi:hypothetical protein
MAKWDLSKLEKVANEEARHGNREALEAMTNKYDRRIAPCCQHDGGGQRMTYLVRVMTGVSMLINVVFGGNLGETVSARNWELKRNNKFNIVRLIDFVLGKDHCVISWIYYRTRKW